MWKPDFLRIHKGKATKSVIIGSCRVSFFRGSIQNPPICDYDITNEGVRVVFDKLKHPLSGWTGGIS